MCTNLCIPGLFLVLSSWILLISLHLTKQSFKTLMFLNSTLVGYGITENNLIVFDIYVWAFLRI